MEYELRHHGIKGQKWGVRRYQTESGSYTNLGRKHYGIGEAKNDRSETGLSKKAGMSNWIKKSVGKSESEKSEQQKMVDANKKLLEEAMKRSTEGLQKKGQPNSNELFDATIRGASDDEIVDIIKRNLAEMESERKGDSGSKPAELKSETAPGKSEINKSLSEMSDKELDSIVKRLENEQKLQKAIDVLYANSQNKNPIEQRISYDDPRSMTAAQMQKAIAQMNQETAYSKALADYLTPKKSFSQQMLDVGKSAVKEVLLDQAKSFTKDFTEGLIEGLGNELANADWEKIIASLNNKKKK